MLAVKGSLKLRRLRSLNSLLRSFFVALASALFVVGPSDASPVNARYTWALPKTVIDLTIVFTFQDCQENENHTVNKIDLKVTHTLVAKYIPDPIVGLQHIDPESLKSFWQDNNIELKTYAGTHILNSIGSAPSSQVNAIFSNVFSGVSKLVAASLGVPAADVKANLLPDIKVGCGKALEDRKKIKELKESIQNYQKNLTEPNISESDIKRYTALIESTQTYISALESAMTITINKQIDPADPVIDALEDSSKGTSKTPKGTPSTRSNSTKRLPGVMRDGRIARVMLIKAPEKILKAHWFSFYKKNAIVDDVDEVEKFKTKIGESPTDVFNTKLHDEEKDLVVSVLLDFAKSRPKISVCMQCRDYRLRETWVGKDMQFRDVVYIPIVAYHGEGGAGDKQIGQPQTLPFAQFGRERALPLTAGMFESLQWSVSFQDSGEMTEAKFSSKSIGAQMTSLFSSAAGFRNAIATEQRAAAALPDSQTQRLESENRALKAQSDNIDLRSRLDGLKAKGLVSQ